MKNWVPYNYNISMSIELQNLMSNKNVNVYCEDQFSVGLIHLFIYL